MVNSVAIIGTRGYPSFYGGFETLVRILAPSLADSGWDVTVYSRDGTTDATQADPRIHSILTRGVESRSLSTLSYGLTSTLDAVRRKPDVALVMNVANGYWLPLLRARGIPTVVNVDGIEWERAKWGNRARSVFRTGAKLTARFGDELVFDAQALGDRWEREFGRTGNFIPYGGTIDPPPGPEEKFERRNYALMVARFVPENTVSEFIEAARNLSKRWDVVVVGSSGYGGEIDDEMGRLAASSDSIHWLGHVSDDVRLHALWANAGAYFHGHSVGGTNPALVQAMASGAPIVARDTVFNREVLGDNALFTAPNSHAIEANLARLLSDPSMQEQLGTSARQRAADQYTWEGVCASYEKVLLNAIS